MGLDATRPEGMFTPGAQRIATLEWVRPRKRFQKAAMLKAHDFNKRVIKDSCHRCCNSIFPEILPLVNSKHWFLKHLLGTCPTRSAGTAKLKCAVRERAGLGLEPLTACLIHSVRCRRKKGKLSHWLLEMMKTTTRTCSQ